MSPDDHYQDLKRVIAACNGKARRINVIMPFLYEGRQHRRSGRESLDCAYALEELRDMGIDNFITFDAHDPRVQNSTPLNGFDNFTTPYQFIKSLLNSEDDMIVDKDHLLVISTDEGALDRAIYFASVLGVDTGMFYKRRDYSTILFTVFWCFSGGRYGVYRLLDSFVCSAQHIAFYDFFSRIYIDCFSKAQTRISYFFTVIRSIFYNFNNLFSFLV